MHVCVQEKASVETMTPEPLQPEIVTDDQPSDVKKPDTSKQTEQVSEPSKLIRIASMVRAMLEEVRLAPLDESGRKHLANIQERAVHELNEILSPELQDELQTVMLPSRTMTLPAIRNYALLKHS